ncbi:cupin domain-containing protein [Pseudomonas sp. Sample_20]|uniref:cupin domain-containing protein n=1 Tax=Pseudomonas sp. Sample_20 TaxID=2448264 RepID=UPI0010329EA2|nr:cupin domain-containing protein [Pseudomonas sp. Sample_20]
MNTRPIFPNPISSVSTASLDAPEGWLTYPIGDDVIAGDPAPQMKLLRTVGVKTPHKSVAFFTSNPGQFHWRFENDEAFVLLEGKIALTMDDGERFEMGPGDAVSIPAGRTGVCEVFEFSRKFTVVTSGATC